MILFLDTVSSLPEFSLIEDNKIIYSKKILSNNTDKMSDCIIPTYLLLEKKFSLNDKLQLLITNTGPGSYTSLRVGIAFLSGLALGKNINLLGLTCTDLYRYEIIDKNLNSSAIFISSSNEQNFFCFYDSIEGDYIIKKIEKEDILDNKKILPLKKIYTNDIISFNIMKKFNNLKTKMIRFDELVLKNLNDIQKLPIKAIINPIYISNNKILN